MVAVFGCTQIFVHIHAHVPLHPSLLKIACEPVLFSILSQMGSFSTCAETAKMCNCVFVFVSALRMARRMPSQNVSFCLDSNRAENMVLPVDVHQFDSIGADSTTVLLVVMKQSIICVWLPGDTSSYEDIADTTGSGISSIYFSTAHFV